ncbi:MAG: universal stress protein [Chitinophagales bacterium]
MKSILATLWLKAVPKKIMETAKTIDADIILMSNKGGDDSLNFFGSNTTEVIRHSDTPILLVPFETEFRDLSKVVYATDYRDTDGEAIEQLINIFDQTDVKLYSLHIHPSSNAPKITEIHSSYKDLNLEFDVINAEDVLKGIHYFIDEHQIQVLTMNRKKKNLVTQLFSPSITEKMVADSFFPVLVINT